MKKLCLVLVALVTAISASHMESAWFTKKILRYTNEHDDRSIIQRICGSERINGHGDQITHENKNKQLIIRTFMALNSDLANSNNPNDQKRNLDRQKIVKHITDALPTVWIDGKQISNPDEIKFKMDKHTTCTYGAYPEKHGYITCTTLLSEAKKAKLDANMKQKSA